MSLLLEAILTDEKSIIIDYIVHQLREGLEETIEEANAFKPVKKRPLSIKKARVAAFQKKRAKSIPGFKMVKGRPKRMTSLERFHRKYGSRKAQFKAKLHQRTAVRKRQRIIARNKTLGLGA